MYLRLFVSLLTTNQSVYFTNELYVPVFVSLCHCVYYDKLFFIPLFLCSEAFLAFTSLLAGLPGLQVKKGSISIDLVYQFMYIYIGRYWIIR